MLIIFRFVSRKAGLDGNTEEERLYADIIMEHYQDYMKGMQQFQVKKNTNFSFRGSHCPHSDGVSKSTAPTLWFRMHRFSH
jgi:hypothetical protein